MENTEVIGRFLEKRAEGKYKEALDYFPNDERNAKELKAVLGELTTTQLKSMFVAFKTVPFTANPESKLYTEWKNDERYFPKAENAKYKNSKSIKSLPEKYKKMKDILDSRGMKTNDYNWDAFIIGYKQELMPFIQDTFMACPLFPALHYAKAFGAILSFEHLQYYIRNRFLLCKELIKLAKVEEQEWAELKKKDLDANGIAAVTKVVGRIKELLEARDEKKSIKNSLLKGKEGAKLLSLTEAVAFSKKLGTALPACCYLPEIWGKTLNKACKAGTKSEQLKFYEMLFGTIVMGVCGLANDGAWIEIADSLDIVFDPRSSNNETIPRPAWVEAHYIPCTRAIKRIIVQTRNFMYGKGVGTAKKPDRIKEKKGLPLLSNDRVKAINTKEAESLEEVYKKAKEVSKSLEQSKFTAAKATTKKKKEKETTAAKEELKDEEKGLAKRKKKSESKATKTADEPPMPKMTKEDYARMKSEYGVASDTEEGSGNEDEDDEDVEEEEV